jgi:putative intracellular protease/amidase
MYTKIFIHTEGCCYDFPDNPSLIHKLHVAWTAGKVVAAVCHGPNGLVNVKDSHGHHIVQVIWGGHQPCTSVHC